MGINLFGGRIVIRRFKKYEYERMDIWQFVKAYAYGRHVTEIEKKIVDKYIGTAVECNPIAYELDMLADEIVSSRGYIDAMRWLKRQPLKIAIAAYDLSLDCRLLERDS